MAETPRNGEGNNSLAVWKGVTDALDGLRTQGVSATELRGSPLQRHLALRQNTANEEAKAHLKGFIPEVKALFVPDGTGSMSDDTNAVQTTVPAFINGSIVNAFRAIPARVQQEISPERKVSWVRIDFGDGSPGWFSSYDNKNSRIDDPYLSVSKGDVVFSAQDLEYGARQVTDQFRSYHTRYGGGGNSGESSAEAALAAMDLVGQNRQQYELIQRLLNDCRGLRDTTATRRGGYRNNYSPETDIVPYLEQLLAGQFAPALLQGVQNQSQDGADMLFLITDEPAIGSVVKLEEVEQLRLKHGLFAIITPNDSVGRYWQSHAQALGAQWFNLDDLSNASASVGTVNLTQQKMAAAVAEQVSKTVARDLTKVLQLTAGSNGANSGSIIRV